MKTFLISVLFTAFCGSSLVLIFVPPQSKLKISTPKKEVLPDTLRDTVPKRLTEADILNFGFRVRVIKNEVKLDSLITEIEEKIERIERNNDFIRTKVEKRDLAHNF